jgi:general secretion pathway protein F
MKTFVYRGYDRDGGRVKGVVEALDLKDAREKLSGRQILADQLSAAADDQTRQTAWLGSRQSLNRILHRSECYRALATMLKAGLPLVSALDVQLDQGHIGPEKRARELANIRDHVRDGGSLVMAMVDAGINITPFESAVLESGERTGTLHEVLEQVADYLEDINRVQQTLKTACLYPAVIVALALVVGTGVMGFLVPQMAGVFEESGMPLPAITRGVITVGKWFLPVVLPALLIVTAMFVVGIRRRWRDEAGRLTWERRLAHLPVVQHGFRTLVALRFARTSALLLKGGVPLVETIQLAGRATGSAWMASCCMVMSDAVKQGALFSRELAAIPMLGPELGSWVRAGEASGDLSGMFAYAAERHGQVWAAYLDRTVKLIEPALIILVAIFVLIVALAILLPILTLNQQLA